MTHRSAAKPQTPINLRERNPEQLLTNVMLEINIILVKTISLDLLVIVDN
jgi:hypothetical protein